MKYIEFFAFSVQILGPELPSLFAFCQSVTDLLLRNYSYIVRREETAGTFLDLSRENITIKMIVQIGTCEGVGVCVEQNVTVVFFVFKALADLFSFQSESPPEVFFHFRVCKSI